MTSEQLEASRAERMRQNGHGAITLDDARTWIEETGLCLFLPRRQFSTSTAPSFVEAVAGERSTNPDPRQIARAEELLVRLEHDSIAVRLNLLGQPGEQPDFVVAAWVLPYVYALRGDRDWRRSPQLTGSRQVSPLAVQVYKQLETGDLTLSELRQRLGREVTESAVLRAITELWQQLRIIPVIAAPGQPAKWQLLRHRFQKAIAEGASTSQVTAISVLASIYLQAVIAACMEEVELFLAPLTARSKVREVLRGLVATRQVHTIALGHAPHFYVAGTLPEFAPPATTYTSSAMPAYFPYRHDDETPQHLPARTVYSAPQAHAPAQPAAPQILAEAARKPADVSPASPAPAAHKPAQHEQRAAARPHFSRPAPHARDRKHSKPSGSSRPVRRGGSASRPAAQRTAGSRPAASRPASGARWHSNGASNGSHNGSRNGSRTGTGTGSRVAGGSHKTARHNGSHPHRNGNGSTSWSQRNGHGNGHAGGHTNGHSNGKPQSKSASASRNGKVARNVVGRKDARPVRGKSSKPALTAGAKGGNAKRYGFTSRPGQGSKKRG